MGDRPDAEWILYRPAGRSASVVMWSNQNPRSSLNAKARRDDCGNGATFVSQIQCNLFFRAPPVPSGWSTARIMSKSFTPGDLVATKLAVSS